MGRVCNLVESSEDIIVTCRKVNSIRKTPPHRKCRESIHLKIYASRSRFRIKLMSLYRCILNINKLGFKKAQIRRLSRANHPKKLADASNLQTPPIIMITQEQTIFVRSLRKMANLMIN